MQTSNQFSIAIHVLSLLSEAEKNTRVTSQYIAGSVNTSDVVIRRLAAQLRKAGLVSSQNGPRGGISLSKPAKSISLLDVYRAVENETVLPVRYGPPNPKCPVGKHIQTVVQETFLKAEAAMYTALAKVSIRDIVGAAMSRAHA